MKTGQRGSRGAGWMVKAMAICAVTAAVALLTPTLRAQDTDEGPSLSSAAADVLRMAESSISDDVLLSYIQNSTTPFDLTADDITYLRDMGLTSQVIDAMLNRDKELLQHPSASAAPSGVMPTVPPVVEAAPPVYVGDAPEDVNYFYSDLSPYGSWVNLEGYGWCWQPTAIVVNTGWRPYCDGGHWVYTEAGWFWDSDYSWGWAPFHYGRWMHHERVGWVWFPDRVWGPAWVTWRVAGNDCGWAPLPLHARFDERGGFLFNGVRVGVNFDFGLSVNLFTFVGVGNICDHDWRRHELRRDDVTRIYNRTTVINNYTVSRGTIVNHGLPVDRVTAVTHTPVQTVPIHESSGGRERHEERSGVTVGVFKRDVHPPARPVVVKAQQVDERHPRVQHDVTPPAVGRRTTLPQQPETPGRTVTTPPPTRHEDTPRATAPVVTPAPAKFPPAVHGRSVIPAPTSSVRNEPEPFVAKPEEMKFPDRPTPQKPARSQFDYDPRIKKATEAHSLPPEPSKPVEPTPPAPGQNTVTHSYTPRIQQATTAHALPAQPAPAPSPAPTRPVISAPSPSPAPSRPVISAPAPTPAPASPPIRFTPRPQSPPSTPNIIRPSAPAPTQPAPATPPPSGNSGQGDSRGRGRQDR